MKIAMINRRTYPQSRARRGVIIILTLWLVTVLALIAYSLAYEMRIEARLTKLKKDQLLAYQLAKAGVAKAICDLKNDMLMERQEKSQILDAEGDVWKNPEDKVEIEMGAGEFTVRVIDEESLLNINTVNPTVISKAIEYFVGDDAKDEKEAARIERIGLAVLDWRDADDVPANSGEATERELYDKLIAEDEGIEYDKNYESGYKLKNDVFTSVEELLSVYGIEPEFFYGFTPEEKKEQQYLERMQGERRLNRHIMRSHTSEKSKWQDWEPEGLRDILTVVSTGEINVNTAGEAVLTAILAAANINDPNPEEVAQAIIEYRRDGKKDKYDNDKAFRNPMELSQVEGLSGPLVQQMMAMQRLTTVSTHFRIIAEGKSGRARRTIEATVRRTWETFTVEKDDKDFDPRTRTRVKRINEDDDNSPLVVESPTVRIVRWRER